MNFCEPTLGATDVQSPALTPFSRSVQRADAVEDPAGDAPDVAGAEEARHAPHGELELPLQEDSHLLVRMGVLGHEGAGLEPDGTLRLYGRDSLVVNTGGEKVFVEEVEEVLRAHPDIADALVVGPSLPSPPAATTITSTLLGQAVRAAYCIDLETFWID